MATDGFIFDDQIPVTAPIGSFPTHGSEKLMVVIFVVDCSKSMEENGRIQAVNAALHELKFRLSEIKSNNKNNDVAYNETYSNTCSSNFTYNKPKTSTGITSSCISTKNKNSENFFSTFINDGKYLENKKISAELNY